MIARIDNKEYIVAILLAMLKHKAIRFKHLQAAVPSHWIIKKMMVKANLIVKKEDMWVLTKEGHYIAVSINGFFERNQKIIGRRILTTKNKQQITEMLYRAFNMNCHHIAIEKTWERAFGGELEERVS